MPARLAASAIPVIGGNYSSVDFWYCPDNIADALNHGTTADLTEILERNAFGASSSWNDRKNALPTDHLMDSLRVSSRCLSGKRVRQSRIVPNA